MANTGFKGVNVRQTGNELVFTQLLQNSSGAIVTSGTTSLYLYELQSDGTLKSYDFSSNTFTTGTLTTETESMTHEKGNNGATNTGLWSYSLATLTGFTVGAMYLARVNNSSAFPTDLVRYFQYGGAEGDLLVTAGSSGQAYLQVNVAEWLGTAVPSPTTAGIPTVALGSAGFDAVNIETGLNARQSLSIIAAACAGVAAGFNSATVTFAGAGVVTQRISASVDGLGNRTALTLTPPT